MSPGKVRSQVPSPRAVPELRLQIQNRVFPGSGKTPSSLLQSISFDFVRGRSPDAITS